MNMCERDRIPSNFFASSTAVLGATTVDLSATAISSPCVGVTRPPSSYIDWRIKNPDVLSQPSAREAHLSAILRPQQTIHENSASENHDAYPDFVKSEDGGQIPFGTE